ncbi:hypothetical protein PIROE2DRAFT_2529 [Piromyces sp. E2]|nr:hypothetical protein PIROE2DRAFT_2529 [Piromyces sp. E2]|eukprot:OUM69443.1 hypothetical protein PIROE2DRAFT_2529 [Piromyces sp. E2]
MFLEVILITSIHIIILLGWVLTDNIKTKKYYTTDLKEYNKCDYPKTKIFSTIFNIIIVFFGSFLAYRIRSVKDDYKERLTIPVYIYIYFIVMTELIESQKDLSIIILDYFNAFGAVVHKHPRHNH